MITVCCSHHTEQLLNFSSAEISHDVSSFSITCFYTIIKDKRNPEVKPSSAASGLSCRRTGETNLLSLNDRIKSGSFREG